MALVWMSAAVAGVLAGAGFTSPAWAQNTERFELTDVFELEWASDPQISPDGRRIVYVRNSFDVMTDRRISDLWIIGADGSNHRALTSLPGSEASPRWSPDGSRILYVSNGDDEDGAKRLWLRWVGTDDRALLATLTHAPGGLVWSGDGRWIAFSMFVPAPVEPFVDLPEKPEGADWGEPFVAIDELEFRSDGDGYLERGYPQLFVLPADGGTPRQLTTGPFNHDGAIQWTPDGRSLIVSAQRQEEWRPLSERFGPDSDPVVSPDGSAIAYVGFDDRYQGYQVTELYVMDRDGGNVRSLTESLDRDAENPAWSADGSGLFFQYDDEGNTKLAFVTLDGSVRTLAVDLGGLSLGRPYSGGTFSVARDGRFAFTFSRPDHPADVALGGPGIESPRRLTALNDDLLSHKQLAAVEEIWTESSYDGRRIQAWIAKPPGFDESRKYPLVLEIHGGPFANYGDRFSAEVQLYAAAGYVVLYMNPRGSTSYGGEFGNLIHHAYPSQDYDDLMSSVDAVIEQGYVDEENLFVTGGSGGGVLTAWIVGKTDRFRAAVSAKPVINWYSFVLTADRTSFFSRWWFPGPPWDHVEHYMARSPLSLVGNVTTPTMLLTGEEDYRTPISESEQFYTALKLRKVPTMLVRIPDASHGIASKPSNLMAKVAYILSWFERYRTESRRTAAAATSTP
jgi:acylaminoacyl-peptidase